MSFDTNLILRQINNHAILRVWGGDAAAALVRSGKVTDENLIRLDDQMQAAPAPTHIRNEIDMLHWLTLHGTDSMFDAYKHALTLNRFIGIDVSELAALLHPNVITALNWGVLREDDLWKLHRGRDLSWACRSIDKRRTILQALILPSRHHPDASRSPGGLLAQFLRAFLPLTDACHSELAAMSVVDALLPVYVNEAPTMPPITFAAFCERQREIDGASTQQFSTTIADNNDFIHLRQLQLMSYNVNNATADDAVAETAWTIRRNRVAALIHKVGADVVCLQELRNLGGGNPTVEQFVASIRGGMRADIAYRNPKPKAFATTILWDATKLMALQPSRQWISDTPHMVSDSVTLPLGAPSTAYLVQGMQFVFIRDGKIVRDRLGKMHPFWVFNTHLGMDEGVKTRSCKVLMRNIKELVNGAPFFVCGDFNTFPDQDAHVQRAVMHEHGLIDFGGPDAGGMRTSRMGNEIRGTFVGYERDEHKAAVPRDTISRLDHVWASDTRIVPRSVMAVWTNTMLGVEPEPELSNRNQLPSDHLPISILVQINTEQHAPDANVEMHSS